jgi:hypothetical protein
LGEKPSPYKIDNLPETVTMDAALSKRFTAVESALTALLDSVKSINPSMTAADAFLEQERALSGELSALERHQRNEQRILDLRRETEENDLKIRNVVSLLAETRKKLQDMGKDYNQNTGKEVDFAELLRFARNISKFTVPPTKMAGDEEMTVLPAAETPGKDNETSGYVKKSDRGTGWDQLPEQHRSWLEHFESRPFVPWPTDRIQFGALASIQKMVDEGADPSRVELKLPGPPDQSAGAALDSAATMPAGPSSKPAIGDHVATGDIKDAAARLGDASNVAKPVKKSGFRGFVDYNSEED